MVRFGGNMNRAEILNDAIKCVCQDRQDQYGSPENNFAKIADFWNTYMGERLMVQFDGEDVAMMMALLKIARITTGQPKADNYIDACGYIACAGEVGQ
jgi:hypothetical protein